MDKWRSSSFDAQDDEPLGPLANLVDIMLVFACGLIAALVAQSADLKQHFNVENSKPVQQGKELIEVPESLTAKAIKNNNPQTTGSNKNPVIWCIKFNDIEENIITTFYSLKSEFLWVNQRYKRRARIKPTNINNKANNRIAYK